MAIREDRAIRANIIVHIARTKELVANGVEPLKASHDAYNEILAGHLKDRVKAEIRRLKSLRKGTS